MGEGKLNQRRGGRITIPEEGGDLGDLTMRQIKDSRLKERTALEQKERERTVPAIVDKPAVMTKEDVIEIPFTKSMRKNLFDLGWSKEEIEKNLEQMRLILGDIIEQYDEKKFREALAFFEAELKRKENTRPIAVKNIEMTREIVSDLKNYIKKKATTSGTPTPEDAPAVVRLETATTSTDAKKKIEANKVELKKLEEKIGVIKKRLAEIDRELEIIRAEKKVKKEMKPKIPETKTFSTDFIKDRIRSLLGSVEAVKEIKNIEVKGEGNEIKITLAIIGKKSIITVNIDANMVLENIENGITVKNYQINSSKFQDMVEGAIAPKLGKIPELVKSFIEKETGKKVAKTKIENGQLKVTFA